MSDGLKSNSTTRQDVIEQCSSCAGSGSRPDKGSTGLEVALVILAIVIMNAGIAFAFAWPRIRARRQQHQATLDELAGEDYDLLQPVYSPPGRESSGQ